MTSIVIELKPTSEFMLASDAIVQAINRLAAAMEAIKVPPVVPEQVKPPMSPERLAALQANAEKARAAKIKLTSLADLPVPQPTTQTRIEIMRQVAASAPKPTPQPIAADFDQVQTWAVQRGMSFGVWDDLPAVNARRVRLGLPPFKREFPVKGRFG